MPKRIVVVGYCASGKSTIAGELNRLGFDARVVGQEHSIVADLWHRSDPDFVIFLDVALSEIRRRRDDPGWPEWLYELQRDRLRDARQHADVAIDTSRIAPGHVLKRILEQMPVDDER